MANSRCTRVLKDGVLLNSTLLLKIYRIVRSALKKLLIESACNVFCVNNMSIKAYGILVVAAESVGFTKDYYLKEVMCKVCSRRGRIQFCRVI